MFRYLLVDHAVPAMYRSLAAARLSADCPSGNAPTTRLRLGERRRVGEQKGEQDCCRTHGVTSLLFSVGDLHQVIAVMRVNWMYFNASGLRSAGRRKGSL
jgi:hypothetical protein